MLAYPWNERNEWREAYVYLGFKEGITKEKWRDLFEKQDVRGMEESLHKILVHPGDTFFIPGGVPHAMGSGVYFAEVQQPTDITLRTERNFTCRRNDVR